MSEKYTIEISKGNGVVHSNAFNNFYLNIMKMSIFYVVAIKEFEEKIMSLETAINILNKLDFPYDIERIIKGRKNEKVHVKIDKDVVKPFLDSQIDVFKESPILLRQMCLIFLVSCFDLYFCDIITEYYKKDLRRLKFDSKNISYKDLLEFNSMNEIQEYLIEKECINTNYLNYTKKIKYIRDIFGITISDEEANISEINTIIKIRNIIIHNNGIVNATFKKEIPESKYKIGEEIIISEDDLTSYSKAITSAIVQIDKNIKNLI